MIKKYEYKCVRYLQTGISSDTEKIIQDHAKLGWRFVQAIHLKNWLEFPPYRLDLVFEREVV